MMGLALSRRARLVLLAVFVMALLVLFPLRLALGMSSAERLGVSARGVAGSIWWGRIQQLIVGDVPVGNVHAALSPVQLPLARARLDLWRKSGLPDDIAGALTSGPGRIGVDDVTGALAMGTALAPLPIGAVSMDDASVRFASGACAHAEGQVKAQVVGQVAGLNLSQGLSGAAQCEGRDLLLPLASQSGLEKLILRISADGRYNARMVVTTSDAATAQALGNTGFTQAGDGYALTIDGML
ncbi:type II secretion system protein N [Sphingobium aquiterrae]|uniref:type II secretion system protein N n=1 Tax=Sphingobium aquiterrae TaxID=2038656 RepID=UPI003015E0C6